MVGTPEKLLDISDEGTNPQALFDVGAVLVAMVVPAIIRSFVGGTPLELDLIELDLIRRPL